VSGQKRINYIQGLPAKEVGEQQAEAVKDLLQCCLKLALSTCAIETTVNTGSNGFSEIGKKNQEMFEALKHG